MALIEGEYPSHIVDIPTFNPHEIYARIGPATLTGGARMTSSHQCAPFNRDTNNAPGRRAKPS